uniref:Uncharacterized protein n=1 Tax=Ditylenchus dipsaci TaxID=166011 RepID=A0A915D920_9BILA
MWTRVSYGGSCTFTLPLFIEGMMKTASLSLHKHDYAHATIVLVTLVLIIFLIAACSVAVTVWISRIPSTTIASAQPTLLSTAQTTTSSRQPTDYTVDHLPLPATTESALCPPSNHTMIPLPLSTNISDRSLLTPSIYISPLVNPISVLQELISKNRDCSLDRTDTMVGMSG